MTNIKHITLNEEVFIPWQKKAPEKRRLLKKSKKNYFISQVSPLFSRSSTQSILLVRCALAIWASTKSS